MKKWQRSSSLDLQSDRYYPYYTLYPVRAYHTESNSRVPGTGYSTVSYTYDIYIPLRVTPHFMVS